MSQPSLTISPAATSTGKRSMPKRNSFGSSSVQLPPKGREKESKSGKTPSSPSSRDNSPSRVDSMTLPQSTLPRRPSVDPPGSSMKSDYMNILHIPEILNSPMSPDRIIQRIIDACAHVIHCEVISLWMAQLEGQSLYCQFSKQVGIPTHASASNPNSLLGREVAMDGIISYVANGSEVLINDSITEDFRYASEGDDRANLIIKSVLAVPVRSPEGRTIAVLEGLNSMRTEGFTVNDSMFLKSMAASLSSILKKQEIQSELQQTHKQRAAQQHIASLLAASAEMGFQQAAELIEGLAGRIVGARMVRLWMLDNDSHTLTCHEKAKREQILHQAANTTSTKLSGMGSIPSPPLNLRGVSQGVQVHEKFPSTLQPPPSDVPPVDPDGDDLPMLSPTNSRAISEYQLTKAEETKIKLGEGLVGMCAIKGDMVVAANVLDMSNASQPSGPSPNWTGQRVVISRANSNSSSVPMNIYEHFLTPSSSSPPHLSVLCVPIKDYLGKTLAVLEAVDKQNDSDFLNSSSLDRTSSGSMVSPRKTTGDGLGKLFAFDRPISSGSLPSSPTSASASSLPTPSNRSFTKDDQFLLSALAQQATGVLRSSQLYDEAFSRARQTQALLHIIELMSTDIAAHTIIQRIIDAAYKLMNCERITLYMIQEKSDSAAVAVQRDRERERMEEEQKRKRDSEVDKDVKDADSVVPPSLLSAPLPLSSSSSRYLPLVRPLARQSSAREYAAECQRELICVVSKDESMRGRRIEIGVGIVGTVALTLKSLNLIDAYADTRFNKENDRKTNFRTKSLLTVPVVDSENNCVAVIQACNRRADGHNRGVEYFSAEDVQILESLANSAGIMFYKSRMNHAAEQAEKKNHALLDLLKVVSSDEQVPLHEVLDGIVSVTYDVIDCDRVTMYFVEGKELFSIVSRDVTGVRFPIGQGISGYAAVHGVGLNIKDARRDPRFDKTFDMKTGYYTQSVLCMPVKDHDGKVLAVIQLLNKKKNMADLKTAGATLVSHLVENALSSGGVSNQGSVSKPSSEGVSSMPTSVVSVPPVASFVAFTRDDEDILKSICDQISDCIRKHMSEALSIHYGANHKITSLLNLYMNDSIRGTPSAISSRTISPSHSRGQSGFNGQSLEGAFSSPLSPNQLPAHIQSTIPSKFQTPPEDGKQGVDLVAVQHGMYRRKDNRIFSFAKEINAFSPTSPPNLNKDFSRYSLLSRPSSVVASPTGSGVSIQEPLTLAPVDPTSFYLFFAWTIPSTSPIQSEGPSRIQFDDNGEQRKSRPKIEFPSLTASLSAFTIPQLAELDDPNFNVFDHTEEELIAAISVMYTVTGLSGVFGIHPSMMQQFAVQIRSKYKKNPFHNFYHGFSCLHYTFLLFRKCSMMDYFQAIHVLALFVSSLCHDVDHPGRTNTFEINVQTDRALIHNDTAVLENHHAYTTFVVLRQPNCALFAHLPFADKKNMRSIIIQSILATDMASHFNHIKRLATLKDLSMVNRDDEKDRVFVCQVAIHSADLGGQTLPWYIAQQWEDRIVQEFAAQAREEEKLGVPTEPFMQNLDDKANRAQLQANFIHFVLLPWYSQIARLFPGTQPFYAQLLANKERFENIAKAENEKNEKKAQKDGETNGGTHPATPPAEAVKAK